jgi:RecB family exonuclease
MNEILRQLGEICRDDPVDEKILVVPSFSTGLRVTDALARSGTSWIGLRTATVDSLALETAGPELASAGVSLLSRAQALALVETACEDVLTPDGYFSRISRSVGFYRSMRRTLDDLRMSGVGSNHFPADTFANRRKGRDVRAVLERYESLLREHRLTDRAGLLQMAGKSAARLAPRWESIHLLGLRDLTRLQRQFLESIARELVELSPPEQEGSPRDAASIELVEARGVENEIRAVFRRLRAEEETLDSAEIAYTSRDLFVPLIHELAAELDLPVTFEEGIPVFYTRPGQALLGYLEWLRRGWDAPVLRKLISSGVIETEGVGPVLAARMFRNAAVGWGRQRHLDRMDALVREHEHRRKQRRDDAHATRRLEQARAVRRLIRGLVGTLRIREEAAGIRTGELAKAALRFLDRFVRVASAADGAGREALRRVLEEVQSLPDRVEPIVAATSRIEELVREVSVLNSSPVPGSLHAASVSGAGWGGRRHLFVVGLDDRFPGGGTQDPVLLDEERSRLNRSSSRIDLRLSGERPERAAWEMRDLLARAEGPVTLSFPSEELLEGRETIPSPIFLDVWRTTRSRPEATYEEMLEELRGSRVGFVSSEPLTASERWLSRIAVFTTERGLTPAEREQFFEQMHPLWSWLRRGDEAEQSRARGDLGPWNGKISVAEDELDPRRTRRPMSSSRIETLARSPFRYFIENVLGVRPLQELQRRPEEWLEPREFGGLFHEMLREFMTRLVRDGELPKLARHDALLSEIAERQLREMGEEIPPASTAAYEVRRKELLEACRIFLQEEERWCETAQPRWFEVAFGLKDTPEGGIDSPDPVEVQFRDGESFLLRGQIDRIDECGEGLYVIWDYKSGSAWGYDDEGYVAGGRQLQHALYALALRELLARSGRVGRVEESGYYFPTRKGFGRRYRRTPPFTGSEREQLEQTLAGLFDLTRHGSFVHAPDEGDCRFCDFRVVCLDPAGASRRAKQLLESSEDAGVVAYTRVREVE